MLAAMIPGQPAGPQQPGPTAASKQYGPNSGSQARLSRQARSSEHPTAGHPTSGHPTPGHPTPGHPTDPQAPSSLSSLPPPAASSHRCHSCPVSRPSLTTPSALSLGSQAGHESPAVRGSTHVTGQHPRNASGVGEHPSQAGQHAGAARGVRQPAEPGGGPHGPQGSDRGTRAARAGLRADAGLLAEEGGAEELFLQEDEVDWGGDGGGVGDPALQHALAVIRAKGERTMAGGSTGGKGGRGGCCGTWVLC